MPPTYIVPAIHTGNFGKPFTIFLVKTKHIFITKLIHTENGRIHLQNM